VLALQRNTNRRSWTARSSLILQAVLTFANFELVPLARGGGAVFAALAPQPVISNGAPQ